MLYLSSITFEVITSASRSDYPGVVNFQLLVESSEWIAILYEATRSWLGVISQTRSMLIDISRSANDLPPKERVSDRTPGDRERLGGSQTEIR